MGNGEPPNNFRHNKKIRNYFKTVSIIILIHRISIALENVHNTCNIALENYRELPVIFYYPKNKSAGCVVSVEIPTRYIVLKHTEYFRTFLKRENYADK